MYTRYIRIYTAEMCNRVRSSPRESIYNEHKYLFTFFFYIVTRRNVEKKETFAIMPDDSLYNYIISFFFFLLLANKERTRDDFWYTKSWVHPHYIYICICIYNMYTRRMLNIWHTLRIATLARQKHLFSRSRGISPFNLCQISSYQIFVPS